MDPDDPIVMTPAEEAALLKQQAAELGVMIDIHEKLVEQKPYSPPRSVRRAQADWDKRRNRALQKRKKKK